MTLTRKAREQARHSRAVVLQQKVEDTWNTPAAQQADRAANLARAEELRQWARRNNR